MFPSPFPSNPLPPCPFQRLFAPSPAPFRPHARPPTRNDGRERQGRARTTARKMPLTSRSLTPHNSLLLLLPPSLPPASQPHSSCVSLPFALISVSSPARVSRQKIINFASLRSGREDSSAERRRDAASRPGEGGGHSDTNTSTITVINANKHTYTRNINTHIHIHVCL